jgi:UDP-3-O-acyl-N-acetylglucosamine deacetylase
MVRMVFDEPARFKVSQLMGNLSLMAVAGSQGLPVGHITAYNASPTLQLSFVQQLMQAIEEGDVTSLNDVVSNQEDWVRQRYVSSTRTSTSVGLEGLPAQHDAELADEGEDEEEEEDG